MMKEFRFFLNFVLFFLLLLFLFSSLLELASKINCKNNNNMVDPTVGFITYSLHIVTPILVRLLIDQMMMK